jgi:hypothetical protein
MIFFLKRTNQHLENGIFNIFDRCSFTIGLYKSYFIRVTHLQPILIAALQDKKTDTYGTFFRNVEEIYKEVTGAEF